MRLRAVGLVVLGGSLLLLCGCPTEQDLKITPAKSGERSTTIGGVLDRTDRSVCEQYLGQLNQAAQMYYSANESYPPNLEAVIKESGLLKSELANCQYKYDPQTGRVSLAN